jgi:hypothetical protein
MLELCAHRAGARRVFELSSGSPHAIPLLCNRYQAACTHPQTISLLKSWQSSAHSKPIQPDCMQVPVVMRYHPSFRTAFNRALKFVPPPCELRIRVFAAWSNALPSLAGVVQQSSLESCKRDSERREGVSFLSRGSNLVNRNLHDFKILRCV